MNVEYTDKSVKSEKDNTRTNSNENMYVVEMMRTKKSIFSAKDKTQTRKAHDI